jgi:hypothetical protein
VGLRRWEGEGWKRAWGGEEGWLECGGGGGVRESGDRGSGSRDSSEGGGGSLAARRRARGGRLGGLADRVLSFQETGHS